MNKSIALLLVTLVFQGCGGSSNKTTPIPEPEVVADDFESLRSTAKRQLANSNAPAVSIAIYKSGEIVFAEAFGTKTADSSTAVDKDTLFQLGSTTKMFTALATLGLIENNILSFDSRLLDALPNIQTTGDSPLDWSNINVFHLLTHQGGFTDFVDWENTTTNLLDFALTDYPNNFSQMNPAGRFWNYSNPNWSYLGAIIEHETAQPYQQLMEERVFTPLAMHRTTMQQEKVMTDGNYALGSGLVLRNAQTVNGSATSLDDIHIGRFGLPAGSYTWSTPSEMLKMAEFLIHGDTDVLADELRNQITSPQVSLKAVIPVDYGFGLIVSEGFATNSGWYPVRRWEHGGNTLAYTSQFWVLPDQDVAVSILSSGQNTDFTDTMLAALNSVITLPAAQAIPIEPVATQLFDDHVGHYEGGFGIADIFIENGQVHMKSPTLDAEGVSYRSQLEATGGSNFNANIDNEDINVTFIPEVEGGSSTYIRNREFVGIRTEYALYFVETKQKITSNLPSLIPSELSGY